jgi:hypothetical protein
VSSAPSDSDRMSLDAPTDRHEALRRAMVAAGKELAKNDEFHDSFWSNTVKRVGGAFQDWLTRWIGGKLLALLVGGAFMAVLYLAATKGWIRP